jgi:hypothetical protein
MTPSEFKAWFDGFAEAIGDTPTPEQWARIREQVKAIAPETRPLPVYRDPLMPRRGWDLDKVTLRGVSTGDAPPVGAVWLSGGSPIDKAADAAYERSLETGLTTGALDWSGVIQRGPRNDVRFVDQIDDIEAYRGMTGQALDALM